MIPYIKPSLQKKSLPCHDARDAMVNLTPTTTTRANAFILALGTQATATAITLNALLDWSITLASSTGLAVTPLISTLLYAARANIIKHRNRLKVPMINCIILMGRKEIDQSLHAIFWLLNWSWGYQVDLRRLIF